MLGRTQHSLPKRVARVKSRCWSSVIEFETPDKKTTDQYPHFSVASRSRCIYAQNRISIRNLASVWDLYNTCNGDNVPTIVYTHTNNLLPAELSAATSFLAPRYRLPRMEEKEIMFM